MPEQPKPIPYVHKRWLEAAEDNVEVLRTMVRPGFSSAARFSAIWYAECIVAQQYELERLRGLLLEAQREHVNPATGEPE